MYSVYNIRMRCRINDPVALSIMLRPILKDGSGDDDEISTAMQERLEESPRPHDALLCVIKRFLIHKFFINQNTQTRISDSGRNETQIKWLIQATITEIRTFFPCPYAECGVLATVMGKGEQFCVIVLDPILRRRKVQAGIWICRSAFALTWVDGCRPNHRSL